MAKDIPQPHDSDSRARQLLDHLMDQWLNLSDTLKSADPGAVIAALDMLDVRIEEFAKDIDPEGLERYWYELGRRVFRTELNRRIDDSLISIEHRIG